MSAYAVCYLTNLFGFETGFPQIFLSLQGSNFMMIASQVWVQSANVMKQYTGKNNLHIGFFSLADYNRRCKVSKYMMPIMMNKVPS
jgi:hypothetical protein